MKYPFLYGAEYYRAPTPSPEYWAGDLRRMAASGFNAVKFFVQWRWVHRKPDRFVFDDVDTLMDLAAENKLAVTINLIFDVAPVWVFDAYPDCRMVTAAGAVLEPRAVACRAIGGYPGPCFNHAKAQAARDEFLRNVVTRYAAHVAMGMWDVWNEPESCLTLRNPPREATLLCYCPNCRRRFHEWLQARYGNLDRLNGVWGRCYDDWREIELPRERGTYTDMVDWRCFNLDTLAAEARRRIAVAKAIDPEHPVYLHPVPSILACFNSITGVDDFQIAEGCDCLGGSSNGMPEATLQTVASAQGRVAYHVECHIRGGDTSMYPRPLTVRQLADTFIPQIGLGFRGFLYWQYRAETLGAESPAWGLLDTDGRVGPSHTAAVAFWKRLQPVAARLMCAPPEPAEVAILKSTANEIFHWCMHGKLDGLRQSVDGYTRLLYDGNWRLTYVDDRIVLTGLPPSVKVLVVPDGYAMYQPVAEAIAAWVQKGGTLICEAHTGGYNLTTGRHSETLPGLGLAEAFGLREINGTAVSHLAIPARKNPPTPRLPPTRPGSAGALRPGESRFGGTSRRAGAREPVLGDVAKAIAAFGWHGSEILLLRTADGDPLLGVSRYAELEGDGLEPLAALDNRPPCVALKRVGRGAVLYIGTLAGRTWTSEGGAGLTRLIGSVLQKAGIRSAAERWPGVPVGVRMDVLQTPEGSALAVTNRRTEPVMFNLASDEVRQGLFTDQTPGRGKKVKLEEGQADLFVPTQWMEEK